jgi:hypothetical protein
MNVGGQPVTAYTITYTVYFAQSRLNPSFDLSDIGPGRAPLDPGRSEPDEIGEADFALPMARVEVSVDFVEFANGAVWGPDAGRSAERLAGMRAGAREARTYLKAILESGGEDAVAAATAAEQLPLASPQDRSPQWGDGFRTGASTIRIRVKKALESHGSRAAAQSLSQPFDAFEGGSK